MAYLRVSEGRCQFCHRQASDVEHMIFGDSGLICSDCVKSCADLLKPQTEDTEYEKPAPDRFVFQRLTRHFAPFHPQELVATARTYPIRQQADLQRALDDLFGERVVPTNFLGIHEPYRHETLGLTKLLEQSRNAVEIAPAQFEDVDIGAGEVARCLKNGLWLLEDVRGAYAVVLAQNDEYGSGGKLSVEVAAPPGEAGVDLCTRLFDALELRLSQG